MSDHDPDLRVIVHKAEEGGYWAEVPMIPGCVTQGDTFKELEHNLYEVLGAYLSAEVSIDVVAGGNLPKDEWQALRTRVGLRELTRLSQATGLYD